MNSPKTRSEVLNRSQHREVQTTVLNSKEARRRDDALSSFRAILRHFVLLCLKVFAACPYFPGSFLHRRDAKSAEKVKSKAISALFASLRCKLGFSVWSRLPLSVYFVVSSPPAIIKYKVASR